jgi:hypothetical protein
VTPGKDRPILVKEYKTLLFRVFGRPIPFDGNDLAAVT